MRSRRARQRELVFTLVRGNPKINGYNLTSLEDFWGAAEGVMDNFRVYKPGHLEVMQAGWAPLRWCLLVNPTNVYADQPLRVVASLASEDYLSAGDYPATLKITGPSGIVWTQPVTVHVQKDGPFAYHLFDADVSLPGAKEGLLHSRGITRQQAERGLEQASFYRHGSLEPAEDFRSGHRRGAGRQRA